MIKACGSNATHSITDWEIDDMRVPHDIKKPIDFDVDPTKLLSFSCYERWLVVITSDEGVKGIGYRPNGSFDLSVLPNWDGFERKFTKISIYNHNIISAVCGSDYTLYLVAYSDGLRHCIYMAQKRDIKETTFVNIGDSNPVAIFGGHYNAAFIDDTGKITYIPCYYMVEHYYGEDLKPFSLPDNKKAIMVAINTYILFALSSEGEVFYSDIKYLDYLSFKPVPGLKGIKIVNMSGIESHTILVSDDGRAFVIAYSAILDKPRAKLIKFLKDYKIVMASAGVNHSLFLTNDGRVLARGEPKNHGELALDREYDDIYDVPHETIFDKDVWYIYAGYDISFFFIKCNAPMSPNKPIVSTHKNCKELLKEKVKIEKLEMINKEKDTDRKPINIPKEKVKITKLTMINKEKDTDRKPIMNEKSQINNPKNKNIKKSQNEKNIDNSSSENNGCIKILDISDINSMKLLGQLGAGGAGRVYKVSNSKYALKELMDVGFENMRRFMAEYELMNMLNHPNIIRTYGIFLGNEDRHPCILLELCSKNLETAVKNGSLSKVQSVFMLYQIAEAMRYVHSKRIIHRDLKPSNILISSNGIIKICDFGISKLMNVTEQSSMTSGVGTHKFMAPEIVNEDNYDEKVDVYSFGVVFLFVLNNGDLSVVKLVDVYRGKSVTLPAKLSMVAKKLISNCMCMDAKSRPSFNEIRNQIELNKNKIIEMTAKESSEIDWLIKDYKSKIPSYDV